ncbi:MAG: type I polyketide synthase, partial [Myxococcota bacterium]
EEALGRPIPTMALFDHPTIDALAAWLSSDGATGAGSAAEGDAAGVYVDLAAARGRLDERGTHYQFDIEADVAWDAIDAPGEYMSGALLADLGVDVDGLRANPEAWALFQWAMAIQVCATFELLELGILFFAHRERTVLGTSTSVSLLCAEEEKHIQLFRRYARHLRAQRPTDAARLDVLAEDTYAYIRTGLDARTLPSTAAVHFLSWLRILFFEEYTVHLHRRLAAADAPVQPAWATAHAAHAREEVQHIATDMAHLRAVDLTVEERRALSALFVHDMIHDFERQFAVEGARRLVEERFPGLAVMRQEPGLAATCLQALVRERVFAQARSVAPFLAELGDLPSTAAPRAAREAAGALLGDAASAARGEPIAIIGLGCRLPGGVVDPDGLWDLLVNGQDAITEVPPSRWDVDAWFDADPRAPGRMYTRWGGFLDGIEQFDPSFFGIAPREARSMDPQQRLLLETAWEALEDAGVPAERLSGSRTGVFLGLCSSDYSHRETVDPIDGWTVTGNAWSIAAGRLSYVLGMHGPCLAVDTACSSGLVALHLAVQSLRRGESDAALVGAANLILVPQSTICFSALRAMSPVGRCKTFDASADGYVRSEAVAMFLLKPLSAALRDGDRIQAVIRGTATNQDGRSNGITAPNGQAQQAVVRAALDDAGLTPADVGYVEAHGTGTGLGDPIELAALGEVMRAGHPRSRPVPIGSIKTNVGHSEGVSGLVGLLKAVMVLKHGTIPPHLHMREPTPRVDWARLALRVPTTLEKWEAVGVPRVAGVSSFGFGGTNAHAIVEEAPAAPTGAAPGPVTVPVSGGTENALRDGARALAAHLDAHPELALADVGFTASVGRTHHRWRAAPVAVERAGLLAELTALAEGRGGAETGEAPRVAMLFTGQGAQYAGMGRALYERFPAFRASIDRSVTAFGTVPLREMLLDETRDGRID